MARHTIADVLADLLIHAGVKNVWGPAGRFAQRLDRSAAQARRDPLDRRASRRSGRARCRRGREIRLSRAAPRRYIRLSSIGPRIPGILRYGCTDFRFPKNSNERNTV